jgi:acyl carrier protein
MAVMKTEEEILTWLQAHVAAKLNTTFDRVDPQRDLAEYGLDSLEAVSLSGELERLLGRRIEPTLVWDHPNLAAISAFLARATPGDDEALPENEEELDALLGRLMA